MPAFKRSKLSEPSRSPFQGNWQRQLATTLAATCPSHLLLKAFKPAICPPSNAPNPPTSFCRRPFQGNWQQLSQLHAPAICFLKTSNLQTLPKTLMHACPRQLATTLAATCPSYLSLRAFKPAVCPPSNAPNHPNPPASLFKATGNNSRSCMPQPAVFNGAQGCLPAFKPIKPLCRPVQGNNSHSYMLHASAICC